MSERACANDERAVGYGICKGCNFASTTQQFRGANRGPGFAPMGNVRRDHGEMRKPEVSHGARHRANIERIARCDEDNFNAFALRFGEQRPIVEFAVNRVPLGLLNYCLHVWSPMRSHRDLRWKLSAPRRDGVPRVAGSPPQAATSACAMETVFSSLRAAAIKARFSPGALSKLILKGDRLRVRASRLLKPAC